MHRNTERRTVAAVGLVALLAFTWFPTPAAAGGFGGGVPSWDVLTQAWAWLTSWGSLSGQQGSYIDPDGKLQAPRGGSAPSAHRFTHLRGEAGSFIDPNGQPQSAPAAPTTQAGSYIDPDGR
jgi:hypothetical protein